MRVPGRGAPLLALLTVLFGLVGALFLAPSAHAEGEAVQGRLINAGDPVPGATITVTRDLELTCLLF